MSSSAQSTTESNCNKKCLHFTEGCGGCSIINLEQLEYCEFKKTSTETLLKKLKFDTKTISYKWLEGNSRGRRRVNLKVNHKKQLCFSSKKNQGLIPINNCLVAEVSINEFLPKLENLVRKLNQLKIKDLSIAKFDNVIDINASVLEYPNIGELEIINSFCRENASNFSCNISGRYQEATKIHIAKIPQINYPEYNISLDGNVFLQASKEATKEIIKILRSYILELMQESPIFPAQSSKFNIADIFSGFGNYSFAIADLAKKIEAFDSAKPMIDLLNNNSNLLQSNVCGKVVDLFSSPISPYQINSFRLLIINPPRHGALLQIVEIGKSKIKNLVYISCNLNSFVRDMQKLEEYNFRITKFIAVDQFYGNEHFETIAIIERRS